MKQKLANAKKAVARNERRILVTVAVTTTTVAVLTRIGLKQHDDFLRANDLYDKFYELVD